MVSMFRDTLLEFLIFLPESMCPLPSEYDFACFQDPPCVINWHVDQGRKQSLGEAANHSREYSFYTAKAGSPARNKSVQIPILAIA